MDGFSLDEREDVQRKTFGKWINSQLSKGNFPLVTDLSYDLRDGTRLLALLEVLTGHPCKPERGLLRVHHVNNVNKALAVLQRQNVRLVNISPEEIVDGNMKLTLGLVWSIILHWQVHEKLKPMMADLQMSNLEKTLLAWCRYSVQDYEGVEINNFTSCWSDGLAFNAVIHRWKPTLFDWEFVSRRHPNARLEHAFRTAKNHLNIERLLDPEDVNCTSPDKKSILIYVLCLFQALPHGDVDVSGLEDSALTEVDLASYQVLLEEVLVWLLSSEDKLDAMPAVAKELRAVKTQFHDLEEFLIELTQQQGSVGEAIKEGGRLLRDAKLAPNTISDINSQMQMLTERWELLRTKAMARQSEIHKLLMNLQKAQLEVFKKWLTESEDRISKLGVMPQDTATLESYIEDHSGLNKFLAAKQDDVQSLSKLVVVVDERDSEAGVQLEDQLNALGERWVHVCKWSEERWSRVRDVRSSSEEVKSVMKALKSGVQSAEQALKLLEGNLDTQHGGQDDKLAVLEQEIKSLASEVFRLDGLIQKVIQTIQSLFQGTTSKGRKPSKIPKAVPKFGTQLLQEAENLQDRLDALMEILDVQKQRAAMMGSPRKRKSDTQIVDVKAKENKASMEDIRLSVAISSDQMDTVGLTDCFDVRKAVENVDEQLRTVESLMSTEPPLVSMSASFNAIVEQYKTVLDRTTTFRTDLDIICQNSSRDETFQRLLNQWEVAHEKLANRIRGLESDFSAAKRSVEEGQSLVTWIQEVEGFLDTEDVAYGDLEALEAQLGQINALNEDIPTLSSALERVRTECDEILPRCDQSLSSEITGKLAAVQTRFDTVKTNAKNKSDSLQQIVENTKYLVSEVVALEEILEKLTECGQKFDKTPVRNSQELNEKVKASCEFKSEIDTVFEKLRKFEDARSQCLVEDCALKRRCDNIAERWSDLASKRTDLNLFKDLLRSYDEFKVLSTQQRDWLDKLERKLHKPIGTSGDTEELSEELDDMENFLKNFPDDRMDKLRQLCATMMKSDVARNLLGNEFASLEMRWESGNSKAGERIMHLEKSIKEIQDLEQELMQLQEWILALDSELTTELCHDVTGEDAPAESQRFASELDQQEEVLKELEKRIRSNPYDEVANKFSDQLRIIQQCLAEVTIKLKHFSDPPVFELRMDRLLRVLRECENKMAFIELASDDPEAIEGQLVNCLRFYEELSEIKPEVEDVLREGRRIVEENGTDDPEGLTQHLDCLKALYNQLGEEVAAARSSLEEASVLGCRLQGDLEKLAVVLNEIEDELNVRESNPIVESVDNEIAFCRESLVKLHNEDPLMARIAEDFRSFCSLCDPSLLEGTGSKTLETTTRCERIQLRMNSRLALLQEILLKRDTPPSPKQPTHPSPISESFPVKEEGDYDNIETYGYSNPAFDDNDDEESEEKAREFRRFVTTIAEDDEVSSLSSDSESSCESVSKSPEISVAPLPKKSSFMEVMPSEMGLNQSADVMTTSQEMPFDELTHVVHQLSDLISQNGDVKTPESSSSESVSPENGNPENEQLTVSGVTKEAHKAFENLSLRVAGNIITETVETVRAESSCERKKSVSFSPNNSVVEIESTLSENECHVVEVKEAEIIVNSVEIRREITHEINVSNVEIETVSSRLPSVERAEMELLHYIPSSPEIDEALDSAFEPENNISTLHFEFTSDMGLLCEDMERPKSTPPTKNSLFATLVTPPNTPARIVEEDGAPRRLSRDEQTQTDISDIRAPSRQSVRSQLSLSLYPDSGKEFSVSPEKEMRSVFATPDSGQTFPASVTPDSGRGGFSKSDELDDLESFYGSDKETDDILEFSSSEAVTPAEYRSDSETETETPVVSPRKVLQGVSPSVLRQKLEDLDSPTSPSIQPPISEVSDFSIAVRLMLHRLADWSLTSRDPGDVILLEPDVAQLISQGDTLVFKIQDVSAAGIILSQTNQLREAWTNVKSKKEVKRSPSEEESLLAHSTRESEEIERWLVEVSHILSENQTLSDDQIDLIQDRIVEKQADIRKLNEIALELCARTSAEQEETLQKLNSHWLELNAQFQIFQLTKMVGVDLATRVARAREAISSLNRQMNSPPLSLKDYEQLNAQEMSLKAIQENLTILQPTISQLFLDRNQLLKSDPVLEGSVAKLANEWDLVNQHFAGKSSRWSKASGLWKSIHADIKSVEVWFSQIEPRIAEAQSAVEVAEEKVKIGREINENSRLVTRITTLCREIASKCSLADAGMLRGKLDTLCQRWSGVNQTFDDLPKTSLQTLEMEMESIERWVESTLSVLEERLHPADEIQLSAALRVIEEREGELEAKRNFIRLFGAVDSNKASESQVLEKKLKEVDEALQQRHSTVGGRFATLKNFLGQLDNTMEAVAAQLNANTNEVNSESYPEEVARRVDDLLEGYKSLQEDCKKEKVPIPPDIQTKIDFLTRMRRPGYKPHTPIKTVSPPMLPKVRTLYPATASASVVEEPSVVLEPKVSIEVAEVAVLPQVTVGKVVSAQKISVTNLDDSRKPSLVSLRSSTPSSPPMSPTLGSTPLLASLDKSILQIRDWLTVLETNVKKSVVTLGDCDEVRGVLDKQKSVLRELEQKKPQLDDLVEVAEGLREEGPSHATLAKVSKLREHWDETSIAVSSRSGQLEEVLNESGRFESRRLETEAWISRMESRISRLPPVGQTVDLLDSQTREQKALQLEVGQFRAQLDQVTSAVHSLATTYPYDDASRVRATAEALGQRYAALVSSVTTRGKALNAAFGTLHHLDRSLDRFVTWLSDAESMLETAEFDTEPGGPRATPERIMSKIKELTAEISGKKEEHASLSAAGQRLLSTLEGSGPDKNPDDAAMLRRRLDDINRRWHGLRAKSVAIRNRLENNREHWSAVLLSLQELIEWVIRKDMELTSLGPLRAELISLSKQQDDFRAFKRQLEDKRNLIEQNILTGRQLVSSEPPASDQEELDSRYLAGDSRGYRSAEEAARELTRSLKSETSKLSERWVTLRDRTERWGVSLEETISKLRNLQANIDDAASRLSVAEKTKSSWSRPADIEPADVTGHLEKLRLFSDSLTPVQHVVDEINDVAARLADTGLPVSHANLAKIDDLNTRWRLLQSSLDERYQQLSTLGGDVGGVEGQNFLVVSVDHPWERSVSPNDVPYYVNHQTETTQWDHPKLDSLMNELPVFSDVRYSAYRTGLKLRHIQKGLELHKVQLTTAIEAMDAHGLRSRNEGVLTVNEIVTVLRSMFVKTDPALHVNVPLSVDLCLNWILNLYDSQRTGEVRVLSFKSVIALLTSGHVDEKYRYLFRLIANEQRQADSTGLGELLDACMQLPKELGEINSFGGSTTEPSVKSCFQKAGKDKTHIEVVHFMSWLKAEPQSLVWVPVLHRIAASEAARHQAKCNICKMSPIVGLRYRCLKCFNFDLCQSCFFSGKVAKHHKLSHPMHEYCTHSTSGEDIKDFTKALRNKFKSKKYFQKHQKLGYLPVQPELDSANQSVAGESMTSGQITPSASIAETPQTRYVGEDVHARLELYANRLAEAESQVDGGTPSRTSLNRDMSPDSEDEHALIAQYCRSLDANNRETSVERAETSLGPRSPAQLIAAIDQTHKDELESMIRELEEENASLQAEYERLRGHQSPSLSVSSTSDPNQSLDGIVLTTEVEREMLAEARMLRQHKARLEARMNILEDHNKQLEAQLSRLRQLLSEPVPGSASPSRTGTLQTRAVTASQLATDTPYRVNGHGSLYDSSSRLSAEILSETHSHHSRDSRSSSRPPPPPMARDVGNLFSMVDDLGKAVGTLVSVMKEENGSFSDSGSDQ